MTIPAFLSAAFNFVETAGVVDVQTTITRIQAQALLLGWTNPLAGKVISPMNPAGQQITLQFNKISATNLEMVFTDSLARTFTRRAQCPASFTERLYLTQYSLFWDPSNGEGLWASILDCSPDPQSSHDQTFAGHGSRDAANTLDGNFVTSGAMKLNAATPRAYAPDPNTAVCQRFSNSGGVLGGGSIPYSISGSRMWYPIWQEGINSGAEHRLRGRIIGALFSPDSEGAQSEFVVQLDESNSALFKVLSYVNVGGRIFMKFACRRS